MAKYYYLAKYVMFYHCLRNILECTTFLELEFDMELKFHFFLKKSLTWIILIKKCHAKLELSKYKIHAMCYSSFINSSTI